MCDPVSLTMAAVGTVSAMADANNQNKAWAAQEEARRKNLIQAVKSSNIADASLQLQGVEAYKAARLELENQTMSHIKAKGAVTTAANESNMEGRSMERVKHDVDNAFLRTKGMITENYERDYHNIWVQRSNNRDDLIAQIEGSQPAPKPDGLSQGLNVIQSGISGAMTGSNLWGVIDGMPTGGNKEQTTNRGK
ncbi:MAG: virion core protein, T7 gp14 family [Metamycoplasmataceae bacterium]